MSTCYLVICEDGLKDRTSGAFRRVEGDHRQSVQGGREDAQPVVWLIFVAGAAGIFVAGSTLARNGAAIAERTGIGQVWIGALLVAGATSLPEITTDTAAVLRDHPQLATGDLFGSNMANMAILAMLALVFRRARLIQREALGILLTASVAIVLTGLAVLFIVARLEASIAGSFSYGSVALLVAAVLGIALFPSYREVVGEAEAPLEALPSLRRAVLLFAAGAALILVAAPVLVASAEEIAEITGLTETFVGVLGLAAATSLPELATTWAAVRMRALDLAVGNLYGSNAINMSILIWLDALYTKAPLLENADVTNAVAGIVAMLLMMVGLTVMVLRAECRRFPIDPAAAIILAGYVLGVLLVWGVSAQ